MVKTLKESRDKMSVFEPFGIVYAHEDEIVTPGKSEIGARAGDDIQIRQHC